MGLFWNKKEYLEKIVYLVKKAQKELNKVDAERSSLAKSREKRGENLAKPYSGSITVYIADSEAKYFNNEKKKIIKQLQDEILGILKEYSDMFKE